MHNKITFITVPVNYKLEVLLVVALKIRAIAVTTVIAMATMFRVTAVIAIT
jgi:hypothetical protein